MDPIEQPTTKLYLVVREGNRDWEDCQWYEVEPDFDNEGLAVIYTGITKEQIYGSTNRQEV